MTVVYGSDEPSGLASMVGGLIDQNLERDPSRLRLLAAVVGDHHRSRRRRRHHGADEPG